MRMQMSGCLCTLRPYMDAILIKHSWFTEAASTIHKAFSSLSPHCPLSSVLVIASETSCGWNGDDCHSSIWLNQTFIGILDWQMVRHVLHDHEELPLVLDHARHLLGVEVGSGGAGAEDNLNWLNLFFYLVIWQNGLVIAFNEKFNFIQIQWSVVDSDFPLMHLPRCGHWFIWNRLSTSLSNKFTFTD